MARPPQFPVEEKLRIVLSVPAGEMTIAEAARRNKTSETSVGKWKARFLEAGRQGPAAGGTGRSSSREEQLQAEVADLHAALGEAHVQLRVWKKSAQGRLRAEREPELYRAATRAQQGVPLPVYPALPCGVEQQPMHPPRNTEDSNVESIGRWSCPGIVTKPSGRPM